MSKPIRIGALGLVALFIALGVLAGSDLASATGLEALPQAQQEQVDLYPTDFGAFSEVTLTGGFLLDPYFLRVGGGGEIDASTLDGACVGYVSQDPSVVLNWSGDADVLTLFVYSDSDPVLVVETPTGEYLCSDDASQLVVDPLVSLVNPAAGTYRIHVGSFSPEEPAVGYLVMTEAELQGDDLADLDMAILLDRLDYPSDEELEAVAELAELYLEETGVFGDVVLDAGFEPVEVPAAGGGDVSVYGLDSAEGECVGFVSPVATFTFDWGGEGNLNIFFEAQENTSLVVATPSGSVLCNDNSGEANLNPVLTLSDAEQGTYRVFVGTDGFENYVVGTLNISGESSVRPEILAPPSE